MSDRNTRLNETSNYKLLFWFYVRSVPLIYGTGTIVWYNFALDRTSILFIKSQFYCWLFRSLTKLRSFWKFWNWPRFTLAISNFSKMHSGNLSHIVLPNMWLPATGFELATTSFVNEHAIIQPNWPNDCEHLYVRCIWLYVLIMPRTSFRVNLHSIFCLNVKELLARSRWDIWSYSNGIRTDIHLVWKLTLNHLAKLTEWLTCVVTTSLYGAFDCMLLSCHVRVSEWIYTLYLCRAKIRVLSHAKIDVWWHLCKKFKLVDFRLIGETKQKFKTFYNTLMYSTIPLIWICRL